MADEGWETPKAKGWRAKKKNVSHVQFTAGSDAPPANAAALESARPTRIAPGLSPSTLLSEFRAMQEQYLHTACACNLSKFVARLGSEWEVSEAVCVGIGSFSLDWEHRYRSLWQLVLFLHVIKLLSKPGKHIKLYAQEPAFTALDTSLLAALSVTVLASDIQSHITRASFLFAPFVDWDLLLPVFLNGKDPELYIGNEILKDYSPFARTPSKVELLKECNALGQRFLEGREFVKVPEFSLHAHALNGLVVSWKTVEEDEE